MGALSCHSSPGCLHCRQKIDYVIPGEGSARNKLHNNDYGNIAYIVYLGVANNYYFLIKLHDMHLAPSAVQVLKM